MSQGNIIMKNGLKAVSLLWSVTRKWFDQSSLHLAGDLDMGLTWHGLDLREQDKDMWLIHPGDRNLAVGREVWYRADIPNQLLVACMVLSNILN